MNEEQIMEFKREHLTELGISVRSDPDTMIAYISSLIEKVRVEAIKNRDKEIGEKLKHLYSDMDAYSLPLSDVLSLLSTSKE